MKKDKETRKDILNFVLDNIYWISDKAYQERVWIKGIGPECNSFDDVVCDFFGDGDPMIASYKDFGITDTQYKILKKFRDRFRAFADDNDWPEQFIETTEWAEVREMAQEVLEAFNYPEDHVEKPGKS